MKADIEIFHHNEWHLAASFSLLGADPQAQGYRTPGILIYEPDYVINYNDKFGIEALSSRYPVNFDVNKTPSWPAFLLDLIPSGAGRRAFFENLSAPDQGPKSDWQLLIAGATNPPGNLRIKQAAEQLERAHHPGFEKSEIIERKETFIEYARGRGAPVSGSTGAQGDAPKFLLTLDHLNRWHADGALPDAQAKKHYIVKFPRGHLSSDRAVLRNEAAYYKVAKHAGLRVHEIPEFINNTLFVSRFDRDVIENKVIRHGQESLCSLAGISAFGQAIAMEELCASFMPHVTHPKQELTEFLLRDVLNVALGNTDNHARNTAVSKYANNLIALSPLYDFAPMILDEQGIARVCRWSIGETAGFPEWGKIAEIVAKQFTKYQINANELRKLFFDFAEIAERLPQIMYEAGVDSELIEQLGSRISTVTRALKEAKPND